MGTRQGWGSIRGALLGAVAALACLGVAEAAMAGTRMGHAAAAYRRAIRRRAEAGNASLIEVEATVREPAGCLDSAGPRRAVHCSAVLGGVGGVGGVTLMRGATPVFRPRAGARRR